MKSTFHPLMSVGLSLLIAGSFCCTPVRAQGPGSIYPDDNEGHTLSFISDPISHRKGDLITIVVNVSSDARTQKNLSTSKTANINSGALASPLIPTELLKNYGMSLTGAGSNETGSGDARDRETMTTTFTGIISEVLPNNTLKVEARRVYNVGKEKSDLLLTGVIRREDIASDNTISSTKVANVQIEQKGSGTLSRSRDKGWLTTIYDFLNPF